MDTGVSKRQTAWRSSGRLAAGWKGWWIAIAVCLATAGVSYVLVAVSPPTAVTVGYSSYSYGHASHLTPTGEKPESKLWWNDGSWWGSLYSEAAGAYHIYRLDRTGHAWVDTETVLDDRSGSKADIVWDPASQKLYVVSHIFENEGQPTTDPSEWGRLYRFSYDTEGQTYSLDASFPVNVTRGKSETLVAAKDSAGSLWVTYVEAGRVMVNRSLGSDEEWGEPFVLPLDPQAVSVAQDDISSLVTFQDDRLGILWSNQLTSQLYFAQHLDGDGDTWDLETVDIQGPYCQEACADDHINLKSLQADAGGRVFAAIKTSETRSNAGRILLLVREADGLWRSHVFGRVREQHTRPVVLLDEEHERIYMFATAPETGGAIYYKTSDLKDIQFSSGRGEPFIKSPMKAAINHATSTRQNLNSATGLLVLASDTNTGSYWHNYLSLEEGSAQRRRMTSRENDPSTGVRGSDVSVKEPRER